MQIEIINGEITGEKNIAVIAQVPKKEITDQMLLTIVIERLTRPDNSTEPGILVNERFFELINSDLEDEDMLLIGMDTDTKKGQLAVKRGDSIAMLEMEIDEKISE